MILMLCGTQKQPFKRLIGAGKQLSKHHEVVGQIGHNRQESESSNMKTFSFARPKELANYMKKADYVLTHGGAGSIFEGLHAHKRLLVFPRLSKYGEHVDDHQLELAEKLEAEGYLMVFRDGDDISEVFERLQSFEPKKYERSGEIPQLIDESLARILK